MRVLVVYAHPHEGSFVASLRDTVVTALGEGGHTVDLLDLHAEGFDPLLRGHEVATHRIGVAERPDVERHAELLRRADALVLVHPTWWGGQPALLKGWFDRVWCEGVAYTLPDGADRIRPLLRNVRHLCVVTTYGSSRLVNLVQGEPGRRTVRWGLRTLLHPRVRTRWYALYDMDRNTDVDRRRFLDEVAVRMRRLGA